MEQRHFAKVGEAMIENVFIQCADDGHFENVALYSAWMDSSSEVVKSPA